MNPPLCYNSGISEVHMKRLNQDEIDYISKNSSLSLDALCLTLGRGKSTVFYWLRKYRTGKLATRLASQRGWVTQKTKARALAMSIFETNKADVNFLIGLALYWAEGRKGGWAFGNTDPHMIRVWIRWCQRFLPYKNMKIYVKYPPGSNEAELLQYWAREVPGASTYYGSVAINTRSPMGVCMVAVNGTPRNAGTIIATLIDCLRKQASVA